MRVSCLSGLSRIALLVFTTLGVTLTTTLAHAQLGIGAGQGSTTTTSTGGVGLTGGGGLGGGLGGGIGGVGGGAAMADFDTLMNLIQQTIEPDSWLANGGTNTILPYPSGVYVDPAGHMKRVRESEQLREGLLADGNVLRHPWRTESKLRTVSLKKLDQAIAAAMRLGVNPSNELQKLAGLSKISYVKIDVANEDILLAGPASDSVFGFELQDVAVVAALIKKDTSPLGCSIDPSNEGLLAAKTLLQEQGIVKRLGRNPRLVVEQMQEKIGAHNVTVFGMPANTGTALALVDADEHMKKVGFGTVKTTVPINSYFDHLDAMGGQVPKQSLIRWWFSYRDTPIRVSASGDLFELPEQCVAVMSEQQWVTQQGRAPTGGNDAAADAFAKGMTERLSELRKSHASYARLSAVFELSLAMQLASERTGLPNLKAWLPTLCGLGQVSETQNVQPKTVEGLTTWHKLKNGTIVAVVSGGVKIDTLSLSKKDDWEQSRFLAASVIPEQPEQPTVAHGSWWWDSVR